MALTSEAKKILMMFSEEEVKEAWDILKRRWAQLNENKALGFSIGERVSFKARKGFVVTGTITKINRTSVKVRPDNAPSVGYVGYQPDWTVAPGLLTREPGVK